MVTVKRYAGVGLTVLAVVAAIGLLSAGALAATSAGAAQSNERADNASEANETVETVSGTLEATDGGDYRLDGQTIGIGAAWYVEDSTAPVDYDGDASTETIRAEFDGLVGEDVTLTVETDGNEGDVLAVNGDQYREKQGPPPWAGGPNGNGPPEDGQSDGN